MKPHTNKVFKAAISVMTLALSGCAGYAPSNDFIGLTKTETLALLGRPNPMPTSVDAAKRLDFPRGPFGKHTYAVYFDDQGKVRGYQQLLTDENFSKITTGMDESEVVDRIGVSKDRFTLGRERGYVWNYRYVTPLCRWFQVEFTSENKVRSSGYAIPPECRVGSRGIR